ncbi:MAG: hypothetical protein DRH12_12825, partial [Deltaproteobacteria bacterium]
WVYADNYGSTDIDVNNNTITSTGTYGIYVYNYTYATGNVDISGNTVTNTSHAIHVYTYNYSSASGKINNNTVHDNSGVGIYLYSNSNYIYNQDIKTEYTISSNTVYNNSSNIGIHCYERYSHMVAQILNNEVYGATHGIYCRSYGSNTSYYKMETLISGNNIHNNSGNGIYCYEEYRGYMRTEIRGNVVNENTGDGIVCTRNSSQNNAVNAIIALNSVHENGGNGIYCNTTNMIRVVHNTVYYNSGYDIYNASSFPIDARFNYWGNEATDEMNASPDLINISTIFDQFDDSSKGLVNYAYWKSSGFNSIQDLETRVIDPINDAVLSEGALTVTGVAHALTGIDQLEVSIDNGNTWKAADFDTRYIGKTYWTFTSDQLYSGDYTILTRVIDTDGNVQDPPTETNISIRADEPTRMGTLEWDEMWSGTIQLDGDVVVPEGVTLTILPGTRIEFPANFDSSYCGTNINSTEFIVKGTLICQGTESDPILFTSDAGTDAQKGDWIGIKAEGIVRIENTTVEYSQYGINFIGEEDTDELSILDSTVRHTSGDGVYAYVTNNASVEITLEGNTISDNDGKGISCRAHGGSSLLTLVISGSQVSDNGSCGVYCTADGSSSAKLKASILNNTIHGHPDQGIYIYTTGGAVTDVTAQGNEIYQSGTLFYANYNSASSASQLSVLNNDLHDGTYGIRIYDYNTTVSPTISGNVVHNNSNSGVSFEYSGYSSYHLTPEFTANQVTSNQQHGLYLSLNQTISLSNNGLYSNTGYDLFNNSSVNITATDNWWGVDTTNEMTQGSNPKDISKIYDNFDDSSKGTVDYSDWLTEYDVPNAPTVNQVTTPTDTDTQTLSGTKDSDTSIVINGAEVISVNSDTTWSYDATLHEGVNSFTIYSVSAAGMASDIVATEIVLDTTAPVIYSSIPANGAVLNRQIDKIDITLWEETTNIDISATITNASVKDSDNNEISGTWAGDYNHVTFTAGTLLEEGTYTVTLNPTDTPLGNSQSQTITFSIDLTAPDAPVLGEVNSPTNNSTVTLSGTKQASTSIWLDDNPIVELDDQTTWSYELHIDHEGTNTYRLFAMDEAGNKSQEVELQIVLDRVPPALQSSTPPDGSYLQEQPSQITFTFIDQTAGLDSTTTISTASIKNSQNEEITGNWALSGANTLVFTPEQPLAEDSYTVVLDAHDFAGNSTHVDLSFTYDATAPAKPTVEPVESPTHLSHQTLNGTKDAESSIWINDTEVIPVNADTNWSYEVQLQEGENILEIYSEDRAGNKSELISVTIIYDNVAPLPVSNLTASGEGHGSTVSLDWNGYDEESQEDVALYRIYVQDHLFTQLEGLDPFATVPAGTFTYIVENLIKGQKYYFAVVAVDTHDNALSSVTPVSATPTDTIPPEEVTNLTVSCGKTSLTFTWNPSPNSHGDLAGYKVYFNNSPNGIELDTSILTYEATSLTPATLYSLRITAYDTDGNESEGVSLDAVTIMDNPTNVTLTPYSGYVELNWQGTEPASYVKYYAVYVSDSEITDVTGLSPAVTNTTTTARVAGLTNNNTYYFAVTTVNLSNGEDKQVTSVPGTPVPDSQGPSTADYKINGTSLSDGIEISHSGMITLEATDPAGLSRVEFYIDDDLVHTDANGSQNYSYHLDLLSLDDGVHTLKIIAYDSLGNSSTTTFNISIDLAAPAATPIITNPQNGTLTNNSKIIVSGTGTPHTDVVAFINDVQSQDTSVVDSSGKFNIPVTLGEGDNRIQVALKNRGGIGPKSTQITVTLDTTLPEKPRNLLVEGKEQGVIRLSWQIPSDTAIKGYNVYRSSTSFDSKEEATKINTDLVTTNSFYDSPEDEGTWFYRVTTVDAADNESNLSNEGSAICDRTAPAIASIEYEPLGVYDEATGRFGVGTVGIKITLTEPLITAPFISITPEGGLPIPISLNKDSDYEYSGYFDIT